MTSNDSHASDQFPTLQFKICPPLSEFTTEVLSQLEETHRRLISYIQSVPEEYFTRETRFRHRLRLDTYSHYPLHARAIHAWRQRPVEERAGS